MLTFRQIEVFTAVMRAGSLIGAARDLRISQPTVTRMVLRIEDQLGLTLFDRVKGRILPTPEAARFLSEVDRTFEQMRGAIDRAAVASRSGRSLFRLGASPSLGRGLAPSCLARLVAEDSRLSIRLDVLSVSQVLSYLVDQSGDAALTLYPILHHDVRSVLVGQGRPLLVVPRGGIWDSVCALPDLAAMEIDWLIFEPRSVHGEMLGGVLADAGLHPVRSHLVRFAESALALAEARIGATIVDEFSARAANPELVRLLELPTERRFDVHYHRSLGPGIGGGAERFEELVRESLGHS
ncbi:MAG: LysR family transcriptional regulator [Rhabdaerophilum sp.]